MLIYTFRTYPHLDRLEQSFPDVFVFGSLKADMQIFERLLIKNTGIVLGIANTAHESRVEPIAMNRFHKGMIDKSGPDELKLFINPCLKSIPLARMPTSTFCNWTMYKIQYFINRKQLDSRFSFIHLNITDLYQLKNSVL